jgi:AcrR family transcriptional regulator
VAVAVRIMRKEGLERLTMRRLAAELDTGPASLYVYVQNMAELHGAILDELLADLQAPEPDDAGARWHNELIGLLNAYTVTLIGYPSLARSVLALRPTGPNYVRFIDTLLRLLHSGGVPVAQAAWGVDLLIQHGTATAAEHGTRHETADAEDEHYALAMALREAAADNHPNIARAGEMLFSGSGEQRLSWMFAVLIEGIRTVETPAHDPAAG